MPAWEPLHCALSVADAEGDAAALRGLLRLGDAPIPALVAASVAGARLSPDAVPGCVGLLVPDPLTLFVRPSGAPAALEGEVGHELGHLALCLAGRALPHCERATERVRRALVLPRSAVRGALARVGWDAPALVAAFPAVDPLDVLARAAETGRGVAIVRAGRRRLAWGGDDLAVPRYAQAWERRLLRAAAEHGCAHPLLWEIGAWELPLPPHGDRCAVILASEEGAGFLGVDSHRRAEAAAGW